MAAARQPHVQPQPRTNGSTAYEVRWRQNGKARQRTFKARRAAERFALRVEAEMEPGDRLRRSVPWRR